MVKHSGSDPLRVNGVHAPVTVSIGLTDEQLEGMFNRAVPGILGGIILALRRSGVEPVGSAFHLASYAILAGAMGRPAFRKRFGVPERTERRWFKAVQLGLIAAQEGEVQEGVMDFFGVGADDWRH